jgi:hypothetical protein
MLVIPQDWLIAVQQAEILLNEAAFSSAVLAPKNN